MANKILIGIDASAPSRAALAWGMRRAEALGWDVELAHVVDRLRLGDGIAQDFLDGQVELARELAPSVVISGGLLTGRPLGALAKRSRGFGLLVVGTHKTGFIFGRTFGSRFVSLGWTAGCPVAFIPDLLESSRRGIVAALDGPAAGRAAIDFASAEAARDQQDLVLVESAGSADSIPGGGSFDDERTDLLARAAIDSGARVHIRASAHGAAESLLEASGRAALLIVGRSPVGGSGAFRSLVHDVLVNLASPVVVIPTASRT